MTILNVVEYFHTRQHSSPTSSSAALFHTNQRRDRHERDYRTAVALFSTPSPARPNNHRSSRLSPITEQDGGSSLRKLPNSSSVHLVNRALRRPLRLLSLDGGGVRGISSLVILKHLMSRLVEDGVVTSNTLPCEYFDMIAGTSTGGIIAILLGRFRMSVDECINLYERLGSEIFGNPKRFQKGTKYSASKLEDVMGRVVTERIRNNSHDSGLLQYNSQQKACPVFVVSIDKQRANLPEAVTLFRSYMVSNDPYGNVSIVEAARATSAAPTYFKPKRISTPAGAKYFVDGGLGHNNPILHLIKEAEEAYPFAEIGCVISIGTGAQQGLQLAAEGTMRTNMSGVPILGNIAAKIDAAVVAAAIATSSEHIHLFAEDKFHTTGNSEKYYRFNVREETNIALFEHKKMGAMRQATERYLQQDSIVEYTNNCVSRLQNLNFNLERGSRTSFSSSDDIQSLIGSTIHRQILESIDIGGRLAAA
ncbi:acyl transferase/acyl hydrolase/lysophospholipase [Trichophaea hybrida]|nr:acyl transferase/acyl hydrolase/lysophospholipase [Trichophaea hybrida]